MTHPITRPHRRTVRRASGALILLATMLLTVAPHAAGRSLDDAAALASLDASLAPTYLVAIKALNELGVDVSDMGARAELGQATTIALEALDATDVRDCFRDWHTLARTVFWLLARSVDLIGAYDAAVLTADDSARDAAMSELGLTIRPGVSLLYYIPVARQQVHCPATTPVEPGVRGQVATIPHAE
jgi:hypothetical protein